MALAWQLVAGYEFLQKGARALYSLNPVRSLPVHCRSIHLMIARDLAGRTHTAAVTFFMKYTLALLRDDSCLPDLLV